MRVLGVLTYEIRGRERLQREGPQPIHWVARVDDIEAARAAWLAQGIDPGPVLTASRETPRGLLQWRITVRDDGQRLFGGALPTLIHWGDAHPADAWEDDVLPTRLDAYRREWLDHATLGVYRQLLAAPEAAQLQK